jgi:hypothetical protein
MKKHYETHVEDTDKLISVAGPVLDYKSWYEQYRKLMEEQAQRKYGLYTPTSEGDDDDFPSIPGMIARYSASGLTNEHMKENPVWVDKTGNGHDLQMKNFIWGEMSGVGGYVQNFNYFRNNATVDKVRIDEQSSNSIKVTLLTSRISNAIYIPKNIYQFNKSYSIKISSEGYNEGDLSLSFYASSVSTATTVKVPLNPNGITEIPAIKEDDFLAVYLNVGGKVGLITIEQLPLYPGALVFDGVDDYGICDNFPILTKEKGYTVVALRQWIEEKNDSTALVSNCEKWGKNGAFLFEYNNLRINFLNVAISFGHVSSVDRGKSPFSYQTSKLYNGKNIEPGSLIGSNELVVGKGNKDFSTVSKVAIWELIILDHDATEEELTKIKDYFVKTYPWLFPNQAWTVVGKTNEDEDRATIANITGNGNDLVLSNLGFIEGSGYNEEGEHAGYLVTEGVDDMITSSAFQMGKDFTIVEDWKFIDNKKSGTGLVKGSSFYIYNTMIGLDLYINSGSVKNSLDGIKSINAACSDGRAYDRNWNEILANTGNVVGSGGILEVSSSGGRFDRIAFKNLAIYPRILSKDDCIKAYNYLQTLKAK